MSMHITPAQAAQAANVSRWTIVRALKSGALEGFRDNRGHWRIDPIDLDDWAAAHRAHTEPTPSPAHVALADAQAVELVDLRTQVAVLKAVADELRTDRDRWHELATQPWWRRKMIRSG